MPRHPLLPALAGLAATLPLPVVAAGLTLYQGLPLTHPAMLAIALTPVLGAVVGLGFSRYDRHLSESEARWTTERRALEDRRRRLADEAAQLQALELGLVADLEEAEAEIDVLQAVASSMSTALGDSLVDMDARLARVLRDTDHPDASHLVRQIEEMVELVRDVDQFTRKETADARPQAFCLAEVVQETLCEARDERGGDLTWTLDPRAPSWVPGAPERLQAVLRAAVRAGEQQEEGSLHLDLRLVDRAGVRGIEVVFVHEPTTDAAASPVAGGLGARLTEALGHPLVGSESRSVTWWMREHPPGDVVQAPLPAARVLVAATEAPTRARLRRLLQRWGLEVTIARSGDEALARLALHSADVVVLDLEGQSLATLERLRSDPATAGLPVLLLGPIAENLVWLPGTDGQALTRPIRHEGILAGVEAVLEQQTQVAQDGQPAELRQRRVLAYEPNPAVAARLVRIGADVGCVVHAVASVDGLREACGSAWDLVLVGEENVPVHAAPAELDGATPRLRTVVGSAQDTPTQLDGVVGLPTDAATLLTLLARREPQAVAGRPGR